jgi:isovaleryl-CoA dehydrogenase
VTDLFNPTPEHRALRELVRSFTEREVDPQAEASDREERFNFELFSKLGERRTPTAPIRKSQSTAS